MDDGSGWVVRPARPEDAGAMRRIARLAYQHYVARMGREPWPMTLDYGAVVNSGHAWVADDGERIVGFLVLEVAADHLLVENVAVAPDVQGQGLGSRLLMFAEEQALTRGRTEVRLYTNEVMTENLAYYARRGYRETHRSAEDGFRRVFFSKGLERAGG